MLVEWSVLLELTIVLPSNKQSIAISNVAFVSQGTCSWGAYFPQCISDRDTATWSKDLQKQWRFFSLKRYCRYNSTLSLARVSSLEVT